MRHPSASPRPQLTFEKFVGGSTNIHAKNAAERFAARYTAYEASRMSFTGPSGTGKTHLLHAIANSFTSQHPLVRVGLFSMADIVNMLVEAIRADDCQGLRTYLLYEFDVLVVDDMTRDPSKSQTWIELAYILASCFRHGLGVVVAGTDTPWPDPSLTHQLHAPDKRCRAFIAQQVGQEAAIPHLLAALQAEARSPAPSVAELLGRLHQVTARAQLLSDWAPADG